MNLNCLQESTQFPEEMPPSSPTPAYGATNLQMHDPQCHCQTMGEAAPSVPLRVLGGKISICQLIPHWEEDFLQIIIVKILLQGLPILYCFPWGKLMLAYLSGPCPLVYGPHTDMLDMPTILQATLHAWGSLRGISSSIQPPGPQDYQLLLHCHPWAVSSLNGRFSPFCYLEIPDSTPVLCPTWSGGEEVIWAEPWDLS